MNNVRAIHESPPCTAIIKLTKSAGYKNPDSSQAVPTCRYFANRIKNKKK